MNWVDGFQKIGIEGLKGKYGGGAKPYIRASEYEAVGLVLPMVNTHGMVVHLREISAAIPKGRHRILVLDQAAWHTTRKVRIFDNLTLFPLPPASPELNPVEKVCKKLRDNWLANCLHDGYQIILDAWCQAWSWFVSVPNHVRQLCTREWDNL